MKEEFKKIIDELPILMTTLNESSFHHRLETEKFPEKGIYVFYENGKPMYTGRSENVKERVKAHGRPSSGHNSATFAFILAKENAISSEIDLTQSREDLEKDTKFEPIYRAMKARVAKMQIKAVEIDNPITQTFFEVYAALELNTPYNEWGTH